MGITKEVFEPKYLGLPVPEGMMHKWRFETTQASLSKRLVYWSEQFMSSGNKEILIISVAHVIPIYVTSVFKLPFSVCDDLTRMMRKIDGELGKERGTWLGLVGIRCVFQSLRMVCGSEICGLLIKPC